MDANPPCLMPLRAQTAHSAVLICILYLQALLRSKFPLRLLAAPLRCVRQSASVGQRVASDLQVLAAAVLMLEGMVTEDRWKPHWRLCRMPAPHPSIAGVRALSSTKGLQHTASGLESLGWLQHTTAGQAALSGCSIHCLCLLAIRQHGTGATRGCAVCRRHSEHCSGL